VLVGLGGYHMFDSLAIDRDGHICVATFISGKNLALQLTGELLTLRSEQRAAPAERPLP
jgi:gluconolactonase